MIHHFTDRVNAELLARGAVATDGTGAIVPLSVVLSETYEDFTGMPPRVSVYPTQETFDYEIERTTHLRSISNRVVTLAFACWGASLAGAEQVLQHVLLAVHNTSYGSAVIGGVTWNRDTREQQHGRKCVLTITIRIPVTRERYPDHGHLVPAPPQTVFLPAIEVGATTLAPVAVEVATVSRGIHTQATPSAVWHCVFVGETAGAFLYSDAGTPVVTPSGPRAVDLTFASPVSGLAYFAT
jgi:hypothetical protein